MFRRLTLADWRQFSLIDIQFHPRLTVITGANGAGKTTILNVLSRHFGWNIALISRPYLKRGSAGLRYSTDLRAHRRPKLSLDDRQVGTIEYGEGSSPLVFAEDVGHQYEFSIPSIQSMAGVYVSSHRPLYFYQQVQQIPTRLEPSQQIAQAYANELRDFYRGGRPPSPSFRIKEALITLATFGYGNQVVERNADAVGLFEGFEGILRTVLPESLGFRRFVIRLPEVLLDTTSGEFSLDAISGGVASIVDLAWQVYMFSTTAADQLHVVIDEPENHLHPELQRSLLPTFLRAFPDAQFVVATHNPFIVGSEPESNVYVLQYGPQRRVYSRLLDLINRSGTADELLRDALGVPTPVGIWVEHRIADIAARYRDEPLTEASLQRLREDLVTLGMSNLLPETLTELHKSNDPAD